MGKYWVYCIECVTPRHLYIGQSRKVEERILAHRWGKVGFTARHGVERWCLLGSPCCLAATLKAELDEYRRLKAAGYIVGGFSTRENAQLGFAEGEWAVEGPLPNPAVPLPFLLVAPPIAILTKPTSKLDVHLQAVLNDPLLPTMRAKARKLAELHDINEEAAMSRVRRSRSVCSLGPSGVGPRI